MPISLPPGIAIPGRTGKDARSHAPIVPCYNHARVFVSAATHAGKKQKHVLSFTAISDDSNKFYL